MLIIGVILAAGYGTRFGALKQLHKVNGVSVLDRSICALRGSVNKVVVVINSQCQCGLGLGLGLGLGEDDQTVYLVCDNGERKDSINKAIEYINLHHNECTSVILHDAARPFVPPEYFKNLIQRGEPYVQYVLPITGGLYNIRSNTPVNRDDHVELCTPIFIDFKILRIQRTNELLDTIIDPSFIYGKSSHLRKITYLEDVSLGFDFFRS
jgi:2-C-methyl-D-erythritol 4-phosphate cytidylyltransferase